MQEPFEFPANQLVPPHRFCESLSRVGSEWGWYTVFLNS
jgi:hypothetical protein